MPGCWVPGCRVRVPGRTSRCHQFQVGHVPEIRGVEGPEGGALGEDLAAIEGVVHLCLLGVFPMRCPVGGRGQHTGLPSA